VRDEELNDILIKVRKEEYFMGEKIIESYHDRGNCELVNRALKEFGENYCLSEDFSQCSILLFNSQVNISL
jgi:hypothetical protein